MHSKVVIDNTFIKMKDSHSAIQINVAETCHLLRYFKNTFLANAANKYYVNCLYNKIQNTIYSFEDFKYAFDTKENIFINIKKSLLRKYIDKLPSENYNAIKNILKLHLNKDVDYVLRCRIEPYFKVFYEIDLPVITLGAGANLWKYNQYFEQLEREGLIKDYNHIIYVDIFVKILVHKIKDIEPHLVVKFSKSVYSKNSKTLNAMIVLCITDKTKDNIKIEWEKILKKDTVTIKIHDKEHTASFTNYNKLIIHLSEKYKEYIYKMQ
jgi:hypothetical protein